MSVPLGYFIANGPAPPQQLRLEPPGREVARAQRAAMGLRDVARDGEPEPSPAAVAVARGLEAVEGLEHPLELRIRNARTRIAHPDRHHRTVLELDVGARAELDGVGDQVGEAALERLRLAARRLHPGAPHRHPP